MKHFVSQTTCPIFHWDTAVINGQVTFVILGLICCSYSVVLTQNDKHATWTSKMGAACACSCSSKDCKILHAQDGDTAAENG